MNTDTIIRLLQNSGFHILGMDESFLYLEDPSCILRSFETFIEYAWLAIVCITGLFLFGWAISMIRGAKTDYFTNLRNLIIIFGTLSAVIPIVNLIWGDDLFARGCKTIKVSIEEINEILDARNSELSKYDEFKLYENIDIYDSGALPYADIQTIDSEDEIRLEEIPEVTNTNEDETTDSSSEHKRIPISDKNAPSLNSAVRPNQAVLMASRADASANDVVYTAPDGTKFRRTGGTRAWRNNNPGNIRYSEFSRRAGAIGEAGGFAVFPDEETGMRAINQLLRSDSYNNLTVAGAISKYAPPVENNTAAYHRQIQNLTGLSINRRMNDLSDEELSRVASAIRQIEGWKAGRTVQQ